MTAVGLVTEHKNFRARWAMFSRWVNPAEGSDGSETHKAPNRKFTFHLHVHVYSILVVMDIIDS